MSRPNPFISPDIRQLITDRTDKTEIIDKTEIKTKDKLHWNAYRFYKQEVKREIRITEKQYVRNELHESKGNINSI